MAAISTSMSPPRGSTKRFGSRVPSMSISGSSRQRLVHHDPRPPAMAAQQMVEHEQRVALAGVDREHHDRGLGRQHGLGALGVDDRHLHARHAQRGLRDRAHEPAHDARSSAPRPSRVSNAASRRATLEQVPARPGQHERQQPYRPAPAEQRRQQRRDRGQQRRDQDQRQLGCRGSAARSAPGGPAGTEPSQCLQVGGRGLVRALDALADPGLTRGSAAPRGPCSRAARAARSAGRGPRRCPAARRGRRGSDGGARSRTPPARPPTASAAAPAAGPDARRA